MMRADLPRSVANAIRTRHKPIPLRKRSCRARRNPPGKFTVVDIASSGELISTARGVLNPHLVGGRLFGNVASLVTATGNRFSGVCIDTGSGTRFCAEHSAIAAMVTAGEYQIAKIVAVWRDGDDLVYVLPPCGRCREFIRQIDPANLDTEVILGVDQSATLRELLPAHEWPAPLAPDEPHR